MNGVSLPLRPVRFHQSLLTLIASHASPLSIQEAYRYGIGTWQLRVAHHTYNVIYEDVS